MSYTAEQIVKRVEQRAKQLKMSARRVSLEAGYGPDLIRDWKSPKAPLPRLDSLVKVAAVLGVRPGWLAFGEGDNDNAAAENSLRIPVISWVAAGRFSDTPGQDDMEASSHIDVTDLPRGKYFGLRIIGDSMNRVAPEGAIIVVNARDRELIPRKYYVFQNGHGATFKRYMNNPPRLEPYSYNLDHETLQVDKDTQVIGRAVRIISDVEI